MRFLFIAAVGGPIPLLPAAPDRYWERLGMVVLAFAAAIILVLVAGSITARFTGNPRSRKGR